MKFFDSHCHLQLSQFDADRDITISHMRESDTAGIVIGTDYESSKAGLELAKQHDFLWASVGLHPNDNEDEHFDQLHLLAKYEELARDPKVVGIGECGLDYFRSGGTEEEKVAQKQKFVSQIELAQKLNKTLIVHCRNAHDDCLEILKNYKIGSGGETDVLRVVIHFFTGSAELAQKYLNLGCYLSFPGPITYTDMYDESIRVTPIDRILSETDSPFAAPVPFRGKRNEPVYVEHVVAKIAAIKGLPIEQVAAQIVKNTQKACNIAG
jgi:TatD DNase family protein